MPPCSGPLSIEKARWTAAQRGFDFLHQILNLRDGERLQSLFNALALRGLRMVPGGGPLLVTSTSMLTAPSRSALGVTAHQGRAQFGLCPMTHFGPWLPESVILVR